MVKSRPDTAMPDEPNEPQPQPRRRRGGRPAAPTDRRRTASLPPVCLTAGERAAVAAEAQLRNLTLSDLVRRRVLRRRLPRAVPRLDREAWSRLGPLAANLNQYVRAIHQGQAAGAPLVLLEQLRVEVRALRQALIDDPETQ
jgi:hypothetical protein